MDILKRLAYGLLATALLVSAAACTKPCSHCSGKGEIVVTEACPQCSGTGSVRVPCPKCEGKGKMEAGSSCPYCSGTGMLTCNYRTGLPDPGNECYIPSRSTRTYPTIAIICVKGRLMPLDPANESKMGRILRTNPNRVCPRCGGTGQFPCSYCSGKGILEGVLVCSGCNGVGEIIVVCPRCHGHKIASVTEPCPYCKGKGTVHRLFG